MISVASVEAVEAPLVSPCVMIGLQGVLQNTHLCLGLAWAQAPLGPCRCWPELPVRIGLLQVTGKAARQ